MSSSLAGVASAQLFNRLLSDITSYHLNGCSDGGILVWLGQDKESGRFVAQVSVSKSTGHLGVEFEAGMSGQYTARMEETFVDGANLQS
ncbi:MAG: hypothetical protein AAFX02_11735 [Pseudomonadota bacterium]